MILLLALLLVFCGFQFSRLGGWHDYLFLSILGDRVFLLLSVKSSSTARSESPQQTTPNSLSLSLSLSTNTTAACHSNVPQKVHPLRPCSPWHASGPTRASVPCRGIWFAYLGRFDTRAFPGCPQWWSRPLPPSKRTEITKKKVIENIQKIKGLYISTGKAL